MQARPTSSGGKEQAPSGPAVRALLPRKTEPNSAMREAAGRGVGG
jgi:hypothetical protein